MRMTVFLCEILIYCVLNNQDRQLGDLWPERAVVAIIKDKKRFLAIPKQVLLQCSKEPLFVQEITLDLEWPDRGC